MMANIWNFSKNLAVIWVGWAELQLIGALLTQCCITNSEL
jgi:hypothetical protein